MIRAIIFSLIFFTSSISNSYENFQDHNFKNSLNIKNANIKSDFYISKINKNRIKNIYDLTNEKFCRYYKISPCLKSSVDIFIISERDLNNLKYFPDEKDYSDSEFLVVGRYFRKSKSIYIVPFDYVSEWNTELAHELTHHLYNIYKINFINDYVEHLELKKFLKFERL